MKKLFLFLTVALFSFTLSAQGIKFEDNHDLNAALVKAKSENKLIFIDAYAEWCGPCKIMARDIFPQKEVGDYFNSHFINLKLDMEKGDNPAISKKYGVSAYPTYLFLNSDGELVHKGLGSMPADKFIEVAKAAADSENNFMALSKKIEKGDRSLATLQKFITQNPYDKNIGIYIDEYFESLPESQIYTEENWDLFNKYVSNIQSKSFQYFLDNRGKITEHVGKEKVDNKISAVLANNYYQNPTEAENLKKIDLVIFEKAKTTVDVSRAYGSFMRKKDDGSLWSNLMKVLPAFFNQENSPTTLNTFAWLVYENYKKFNDTESLKNAIAWAKKAHEGAQDNGAIADTYAHLLYENGNKKEAIKVETKALELASKSGDAESIDTYKKAIEQFKAKKAKK